ncbi:MAG: class I SAM-dependent methyltransferase, partial [Ginsengibacter sp.]
KSKIRSFNCLHKIPNNINIDIYNVESNGALHEGLKHINNYVCSEYFGPVDIIGKELNGILNIDLREIPFKENNFDFVITTEVFEHVPEPYKGFEEIHRVLKKGGSHIFTVPYKGHGKDEVKAIIGEDGEIIHLAPPEYHGDPIRGEGILVYTIFAEEMQEKLKEMGFNVKVNHTRNPIWGILGDNNYVFIATKL